MLDATCSACEAPNAASAKFCRNCGVAFVAATQHEAAPADACGQCGGINREAARFCRSCGSVLPSVKVAATLPPQPTLVSSARAAPARSLPPAQIAALAVALVAAGAGAFYAFKHFTAKNLYGNPPGATSASTKSLPTIANELPTYELNPQWYGTWKRTDGGRTLKIEKDQLHAAYTMDGAPHSFTLDFVRAAGKEVREGKFQYADESVSLGQMQADFENSVRMVENKEPDFSISDAGEARRALASFKPGNYKKVDGAIDAVARQLPQGFPEDVATAIFEGMRSQARRLQGQPAA